MAPTESLHDHQRFGICAPLLATVPTPDHYLPLLYVLGTQQPGDVVTFPVQGIDGGSISMLSVRIDSSAVRSVESVE